MSISVLILYDPKGPAIKSLAGAVAKGVISTGTAQPSLKTIAEATTDNLLQADALILGSPNWSGVTGTLKSWLDEQGDLWEEGILLRSN